MKKNNGIIGIILAGGEGTRMKSGVPKVLHNLAGKPLLLYPINAVIKNNCVKNIVVVGRDKDQVIEAFKEYDLVFTEQVKRLGSGDALKTAIKKIPKTFRGDIVILCGDTPLLTGGSLRKLISEHKKKKNKITILTAKIDNPFGYGRISRNKENKVTAIIEEKDASSIERNISEVNSGVYCCDYNAIKQALPLIKNNNKKNEYYLTDVVKILASKGARIGAFTLSNSIEIRGVNTRMDLAKAQKHIMENITNKLMSDGVTILYPEQVYIEDTVKIGRDTIILPGCMLKGKLKIGKACVIGPNTVIEDCALGDGVEIRSSYVYGSKIGDNVKIGPFSHVRPGTVIGNGARIGNFSEIKKSQIGSLTKVSHLSYIGDTKLGRDVNIGAGTITCNYDGKDKHESEVGDGSFIGSNTNLIAPIKIGKNVIIAAGSTINQDVPDNSLSIARSRQTNKLGWVASKKRRKK
ncbi:MAG: bifunctional UDP-N-acetylglucosamine diphosphorylase/glucosamine-1-phosphate N-acetyltransferase GlmU [Elusimicrobiota bacterium]